MQESFLHFLWRFQYFDTRDLRTVGGESLQVLGVGMPHADAGPDFRQARVRIGDVEWAGHVEIHRRSSEWESHAHQHDGAYNNVILHVVWEDDRPVCRPDGSLMPTLALQSRARPGLLSRYQALLNNRAPIPCAGQFADVSSLEKRAMLDRVLLRRLEEKAQLAETLWYGNGRHWETTAYQLLAHAFGFKINADPFLRLAQALPLKVLHKHRNQTLALEALLFGAAGLLPAEALGPYGESLRQEYTFLRYKYQLPEVPVAAHEWKFLRLRPANFPTVRLAQLATLLANEPSPFTLLAGSESVKELISRLQVMQSDYWQAHYVWKKPAKGPVPGLGKAAAESVIINAAIPLLVCYAQQQGNRAFLERAVAWLEELPAERNHLTRLWEQLGLSVRSAFDSQACIELYNHYCATRQCLRCSVGVSLLRAKE